MGRTIKNKCRRYSYVIVVQNICNVRIRIYGVREKYKTNGLLWSKPKTRWEYGEQDMGVRAVEIEES